MTNPQYYPIELFHYIGINDLLKVKYILNKYPEYLNSINSSHDNLLFVAIHTHSNKIVKFLIQSTNIDLNYSYKNSSNEGNALSVAIGRRNHYAISLLLKTNINKQELSFSGYSPFLEAINQGHLPTVKFLLKNKNFDTEYYLKNEEVLSLAIKNKNFSLTNYLLKHKFLIDLIDPKNEHLLLHVIESFNIPLVNLLTKDKKFSHYLLTKTERYKLLDISTAYTFSFSFFKKLWLSIFSEQPTIFYLKELFLNDYHLLEDDRNLKKIKFLLNYLNQEQQEELKKEIFNHLTNQNTIKPQIMFYLSNKEKLLDELNSDLTIKKDIHYKRSKL